MIDSTLWNTNVEGLDSDDPSRKDSCSSVSSLWLSLKAEDLIRFFTVFGAKNPFVPETAFRMTVLWQKIDADDGGEDGKEQVLGNEESLKHMSLIELAGMK